MKEQRALVLRHMLMETAEQKNEAESNSRRLFAVFKPNPQPHDSRDRE